MTESTDYVSRETVLEKLRAGWELYSYGAGWWVGAPRQPYKKHESYPVANATVDELEREGIIKTVLKSRSAVGELIEKE